MKTAKVKPFVRTIKKSGISRDADYAVHGFWSGSNVRVMQTEDYKTRGWGASRINWSSGGEDTAIEPDRAFATECFAAAMKDAARLARRWNKDVTQAK